MFDLRGLQSVNMADIRSLKDRVRSSIHTAEDLLAIMMASTSSQALTNVHVGYIKKMKSLTYNVAIELLGIKPMCRDLINDVELKDFSTSMIDISHKASNLYIDLCTRMDPTQTTKIHTANLVLQIAIQDIQRDADHTKLGTTKMAKGNYANITINHDYLLEEVMKHKDYLSAEDHIIIEGMEQREEWKKSMDQITRELLHLTITITSHNIPCTDVNIRA